MTSLCLLAYQVSGFFGGVLRPHICMCRFPPKTGIWAFICGQKSNSGCAGFQKRGERMLEQSQIFFFNYACHGIALFDRFGSRYNLKGNLTSHFLYNFRISVIDKNQNKVNQIVRIQLFWVFTIGHLALSLRLLSTANSRLRLGWGSGRTESVPVLPSLVHIVSAVQGF